MAGISIRIGGDLREFRRAVREMRLTMRELGRMFRPVSRTAAAAFRGLYAAGRGAFRALGTVARRTVAGIRQAFSGLKSIFTGGGPLGAALRLAGVAGGLALFTAQVRDATRVAGGIEQTEMALQALTGSGDEARRVLDEMRKTWSATGVDIASQARTIQKFLALGFSSADAVKLQRNILDVAGGVGMTAEEASLLGSALAQVKAKGVVSMEELRQQIAEKGVPVFEALAQKIGVTEGELIKLVEGGQVPAQALLDIFLNMEGAFGRFSGGAQRMGSTFLGTVARLRAAWQQLTLEFTRPILDAFRPLLENSIERLDSLRQKAAEVGAAVRDIFLGAFVLIRDGRAMELISTGFRLAVAGAIDLLMRGLRGAVAFLASALPPIFSTAMAKLQDERFWEGIIEIFKGVGSSIRAEIESALGQEDLAMARRDLVEQRFRRGSRMVTQAGNGADIGEVLTEALSEGITAAAKAASGPSSQGVRTMRENFNDLLGTVGAQVRRIKEGLAPAALSPQAAGGGTMTPFSLQALGAELKKSFTITGALARVGGGSFGVMITPMVSQQQRTNQKLDKIERNTRRDQASAAASMDIALA